MGPRNEMPSQKERLFEGKKVLVTGGNRDIGKGIALAFAREGAYVIGSFHRDNQEHHALDVVKEAEKEGGRISFFQADFETFEGRVKYMNFASSEFGEDGADILVLSTSGPTDVLNEIADRDLVDLFLEPQRKKRENGERLEKKLILRIQSVPGHFYGQFDESLIPEVYKDVARYKHEAEVALLKREKEFKDLNVQLIFPTPPLVTETQTVRAFRRVDPTMWEKHDQICDKYNIPRTVSIYEVANRILNLAGRNDLPQGYVYLFKNIN